MVKEKDTDNIKESRLEERLEKLEKEKEERIQKLEEEVQGLKQKLNEKEKSSQKANSQSKRNERSSSISRRGFLKGLGALGVSALAMSSPVTSKMTVSSNTIEKDGTSIWQGGLYNMNDYIQLDGSNAMTGNLNMNGNNLETGGGNISIYDTANSQELLKLSEGGPVEIMSSDLIIKGNTVLHNGNHGGTDAHHSRPTSTSTNEANQLGSYSTGMPGNSGSKNIQIFAMTDGAYTSASDTIYGGQWDITVKFADGSSVSWSQGSNGSSHTETWDSKFTTQISINEVNDNGGASSEFRIDLSGAPPHDHTIQ